MQKKTQLKCWNRS